MEIIAFRTIKYNDKHSILSAFTSERGRVSLFIPAGNGREAKRRRALLMPMSVADCEIRFRPTQEIHSIVDIKPGHTAINTATHPVRSSIALFLADFFGGILRESGPDRIIFQFVKNTAILLDCVPEKWLPNFHIITLSRFSHLMGVGPDLGSYIKGGVFDMRDGIWRATPPLHGEWISPPYSRIVKALTCGNFHHSPLLPFSRDDRNEILDEILRYYSVHFSDFPLPSLSILRDL